MAFLIPDNLKSRPDVPAGIRRVASGFLVGLGEDVVVWYEPLFDPTGEKPHLVVLIPQRGIVVLEVLEVKAGGLLGILRGRFRLERDGREVEVASPLERAERLAEALRMRVAGEPRLQEFKIPVAAGAVLPSLDRGDAEDRKLGSALSLDTCLFKDDIEAAIGGSGEAGLVRAFGRILGETPGHDLPEDLEKVLRGIIQPEIVIDRVGNTENKRAQLTIFQPPGDGKDIVRVMDRKQEAMAKSLGEGHRVIRGVAGSGKTLILVYRAKLLAKMFPQHRFLVTCYTRSLAGQLRALLVKCGNVEVKNLDNLMAKVIYQARLAHPGYKNDDGDAVTRVALQALQKGAGPRYFAVLLDEAQDFGTDGLRFAVGLLQNGRHDLVIVADAAQNIFRRKFSWKQAGIQAQGRTRILRTNYRNTKEILEFASRFLLSSSVLVADEVPDFEDENAVIPPESAHRAGVRPDLHLVKDGKEEVAKCVEQVGRWTKTGARPRGIAVLYGTQFDRSGDRAKALFEGMVSLGIGVFWLNNPDDKTARDRLAQADAPVILSTVHNAKGLEFSQVVLCGVWKEGQDIESNRKLVYVGMTRAMDQLVVVSKRDHPLAKDLQEASEEA